MIEIGRVCLKTAGRDAGKKGAIIDLINDNFVVIDGDLRRKKCNIRHLEPLPIIIKINRNATHEEVTAELGKQGIIVKYKPAEKNARATPVIPQAKAPRKADKAGQKEKPAKK